MTTDRRLREFVCDAVILCASLVLTEPGMTPRQVRVAGALIRRARELGILQRATGKRRRTTTTRARRK